MSKARIKKIMTLLNLSLEDAKKVDAKIDTIIHTNDYDLLNDKMDEINDIIGGNGVEILRANETISFYWQDCAYLYVNMGDTYDQTVIYDTENNKVIIGDWGSIVEKQPNRFD